MTVTIANQYLNQNAGRRYPMADDSSGLPDRAIVDFRCTILLPSGGKTNGKWEVTLTRVDRAAQYYKFSFMASDGVTSIPLSVDVPSNAAMYYTAMFDVSGGSGSGWYAVTGAMTVGDIGSLDGHPDVGAVIDVPMAPSTVCVDSQKLMSITADADQDGYIPCTDTLTGDILLVEGYNTVPTLSNGDVSLYVEDGAGLGNYCAATSSDTCDGIMLMLNGNMAGTDGDVKIRAGAGVTVTDAPDEHAIEICLDSVGSSAVDENCDDSEESPSVDDEPQPVVPAEPQKCLCFISKADGSWLRLSCTTLSAGAYTGEDRPALEFSTDSEEWVDYSIDETIYLNKGERCYFRATRNNTLVGLDDAGKLKWYSHFWLLGRFDAEGSVMSLLDPSVARMDVPEYGMANLFYQCSALESAPELPATYLGRRCYSKMFYGTGLTESPDLPAVEAPDYAYCSMFTLCTGLRKAGKIMAAEVGSHCCYSMFEHCRSLVDAPPNLYAMSVPDHAYANMFRDCSTLSNPPAIHAKSIGEYGCNAMFMGCGAMTSAPELQATSMSEGCCSSMFSGCTSLSTVQNRLPATSMADSCYSYMFNECSSLTNAPELPATVLAPECYENMFRECTSLTEVPLSLPASVLPRYCYVNMFRGCTALVTGPAILGTVVSQGCCSCMFRECTSLVSATDTLMAEKLEEECYYGMFMGCTSLESGPDIMASEQGMQSCWKMFYGCTSLTDAPDLKATVLDLLCYEEMFAGCTALSSLTVMFTRDYVVGEPSATTALSDWLKDVAPAGILKKPRELELEAESDSGVPSGWTTIDID